MNLKEISINILITSIVIILIIASLFLVLSELNKQTKEAEKSCNRISIDSNHDNCMCPCEEQNWIEKKLNLKYTCDGWIVEKDKPCIQDFRAEY